jgi:site-specific DNA-methyltransferase (adenine-specific)
MLPINQIIQGDCLEVMRRLPDSSIDLILCDPPYFRVKADWWDNQWANDAKFLEWITQLTEQWQRLLKPNGSLYCFASPKMAARVEVTIGQHFNILNNIRWDKTNLANGGRHKASHKEGLRSYFCAQESIIFAEQFGADSNAKGESGYSQKCDELKSFVFEPLRAYLDGERERAGVKPAQIIEWFAAHGYPKYATARHSFSRSQWELPTKEAYLRLRQCFKELGNPEYEALRSEYEALRSEYEALRRPFGVTAKVPYTDTWAFDCVPPRKNKHSCEKPAVMLDHIISASSLADQVVLDCFAGSGSTLISAQKLRRNFIGIEIDPHWVQVATTAIGGKNASL